MVTHVKERKLATKKINTFIYCTSASVRHSTCRKDPNSTESVEEAALKASGPMPCALLIVTRAFLPSNSDWWARRGGLGILQRRQGASGGEKLCVKVPSLLSEGWHGASGDAGGAFGALSLDTGLVSPPPVHNPPTAPTLPLLLQHPTYKYSSAASSHLFFTVSLTSMNWPPPPTPYSILTSFGFVFLSGLCECSRD